MIESIWLFVIIITFLVALMLTKTWIHIATREKLVVKDANKFSYPLIPIGGGIAVIMAFILSALLYIGISVFYFNREIKFVEALALLVAILITTLIGVFDVFIGGWKKGLSQWKKPLLTLPAALPLMVIHAGISTMSLPFLGRVDIGILYPLLAIPIGIVGASQGFNMLAGLNGLESGMASIMLSFLGYIAWSTNQQWLAILIFSMVLALMAFLVYNRYPAKVFPGDTLLYPLGALIAAVAILGNMERIAIILFIPYFIELGLKARYKFKTESFLIPQKDGSVRCPERISSMTHVACKFLEKIKKKVYEYDVVNVLCLFELTIGVLAIIFMY
jgi:UDP-N-acetylglucosamine--dolichyl-phosphate N-acetylglucosaminephosphotransferase